MLTFDIKRKINTLRDILVGKVPDPKAQVEQITIAMIYKFMDDMDTDGIEFGGRAFFVDEYEKYAWSNIMNPQVGGRKRIIRYSEGMEAMQRNPHLPPLFREIFKNAYLPYRDSETLNLFLAEINEFKYDNSEDLGNAFEYLLSIMGSQGDAGQFRTPRHIIDMMVEIIRPKKNEKLLDPACGTAGFLISAYKYIVSQNRDEKGNDNLTTTDRANLTKNFVGYDISPDMVRLSRVNMYLHRFLNPQIYEKDTLTDKELWQNQYFDVILANPPFMTPKGGINPHKLFRVQAKRSEVLFVDYIAENLAPSGRAAIIVPEGIVFQTATAYTSLRKMLVDEGYLYGVISMPSGVFNPYSGVKTSILLIDKSIAKETDKILFVKMNSDGYSLGAQRRKLDGAGDISKIVDLFKDFRKSVLSKKEFITDSELATIADKETIKNNNSYILVGERYKIAKIYNTDYPMVKLGEVLEYEQPTKYIVNSVDYDDNYSTPVLTAGQTFILGHTNEKEGIFQKPLPVIIFDDFTTATKFVDFPFKVKSSAMKILKNDTSKTNIKYLYHVMQNIAFDCSIHKRYWIAEYSNIEIPLPPIDIQNKIVAEIEEYQKIIDGAKQVVDNYKPTIEIDPEWEIVKLGDESIFYIESGGTPDSFDSNYWNGSINWATLADLPQQEYITKIRTTIRTITQEGLNKSSAKVLPVNSVIISSRATIGRVAINDIPVATNQGFKNIIIKDFSRINTMFLALMIKQNVDALVSLSSGGTFKEISKTSIKSIDIFLPSLEIQDQIIAKIEEEQKSVESCKKLIEIYEQKIKDKISSIWGE